MHIDIPQAQVSVSPFAPLRLTHARGTRLRSQAGTLWITVDGEAQDWVLPAGQSLQVESARPVYISALGGTATVGLCAPKAPGRRHWADQLRGALQAGTPGPALAA